MGSSTSDSSDSRTSRIGSELAQSMSHALERALRIFGASTDEDQERPLQKTPQISPIFKSDSVTLHVSREKDGKLRPDPPLRKASYRLGNRDCARRAKDSREQEVALRRCKTTTKRRQRNKFRQSRLSAGLKRTPSRCSSGALSVQQSPHESGNFVIDIDLRLQISSRQQSKSNSSGL